MGQTIDISLNDEDEEELIKMNKLVAAIILTSQGISIYTCRRRNGKN